MPEAAGAPSFASRELLAYGCGVLEASGLPAADARKVAACLPGAAVAALVDGGNGLGPVVGSRATEKAIELAETNGVGLVGVCHGNHFGAAFCYVRKAVEREEQ